LDWESHFKEIKRKSRFCAALARFGKMDLIRARYARDVTGAGFFVLAEPAFDKSTVANMFFNHESGSQLLLDFFMGWLFLCLRPTPAAAKMNTIRWRRTHRSYSPQCESPARRRHRTVTHSQQLKCQIDARGFDLRHFDFDSRGPGPARRIRLKRIQSGDEGDGSRNFSRTLSRCRRRTAHKIQQISCRKMLARRGWNGEPYRARATGRQQRYLITECSIAFICYHHAFTMLSQNGINLIK
jgi:hypothetical protein